MILNLLENAYKYSIPNGTIAVIGHRDNGEYNIEISNESYDLGKVFNEKVFEPFVRGKNAIELDGNGLGLYICKLIVDEYNGYIRVEVQRMFLRLM